MTLLAACLFWIAATGLAVSSVVHLSALMSAREGDLTPLLWLHLLLLALAAATLLIYRSRGESFEDSSPRTRAGRWAFAFLFLYCAAQGAALMRNPDENQNRWRFHSSAWVLGFSLLGFHLHRLSSISK
jgi:hypothetical protein